MQNIQLSADFFKKNRQKLSKKLATDELLIIQANDKYPRNGDQFFKYRQNSDFYYLTGLNFSDVVLMLFPGHTANNLRELLFIEKPDEKKKLWEGNVLTVDMAQEISGISTIEYLEDFNKYLSMFLSKTNSICTLQNEFSTFETANKKLTKLFLSKKSTIKIKSIDDAVHDLRMVKSEEEIACIKKACDITINAYNEVLKNIKPNMYEYEIEAMLDYSFKKQSNAQHAYPPIVAGGKNALILHYSNNNQMLQDHDLVLMDFGAEYNNYAADMSRTIPVNGRFTARQKQVYKAVLNVQTELISHIKAGQSIKDINALTKTLTDKQLIDLKLFSINDLKNENPKTPLYKKYLMHGTSHFMGLDVHDCGNTDVKLKAGMVITCEPALYIKQENIGIRLENDLLITENGNIDLLKNAIIEPDEIEEYMNNR